MPLQPVELLASGGGTARLVDAATGHVVRLDAALRLHRVGKLRIAGGRGYAGGAAYSITCAGPKDAGSGFVGGMSTTLTSGVLNQVWVTSAGSGYTPGTTCLLPPRPHHDGAQETARCRLAPLLSADGAIRGFEFLGQEVLALATYPDGGFTTGGVGKGVHLPPGRHGFLLTRPLNQTAVRLDDVLLWPALVPACRNRPEGRVCLLPTDAARFETPAVLDSAAGEGWLGRTKPIDQNPNLLCTATQEDMRDPQRQTSCEPYGRSQVVTRGAVAELGVCLSKTKATFKVELSTSPLLAQITCFQCDLDAFWHATQGGGPLLLWAPRLAAASSELQHVADSVEADVRGKVDSKLQDYLDEARRLAAVVSAVIQPPAPPPAPASEPAQAPAPVQPPAPPPLELAVSWCAEEVACLDPSDSEQAPGVPEKCGRIEFHDLLEILLIDSVDGLMLGDAELVCDAAPAAAREAPAPADSAASAEPAGAGEAPAPADGAASAEPGVWLVEVTKIVRDDVTRSVAGFATMNVLASGRDPPVCWCPPRCGAPLRPPCGVVCPPVVGACPVCCPPLRWVLALCAGVPLRCCDPD